MIGKLTTFPFSSKLNEPVISWSPTLPAPKENLACPASAATELPLTITDLAFKVGSNFPRIILPVTDSP
ncbi:hypothetical protein D9M72_632220 [compost metagenome]